MAFNDDDDIQSDPTQELLLQQAPQPAQASQGPSLVDTLKSLQTRNQAPGVLGFLQQAFQVANSIGNPEAAQEYQKKLTAQKLAALPEAEALQGPYREAAAQELANNKIDQFSHILTESRRQGNINRRADQEKNLSDQFGTILQGAQKNLQPEDFAVVNALHKNGQTMKAINYLNGALGRTKSEDIQKTGEALKAVTDQAKQVKEQANPVVQNTQDLLANVRDQNISDNDLKNITNKDVFKKYGLTASQALQLNQGRVNFENKTGSKIGSPGFLYQIGAFFGMPQPKAASATDFLQQGLQHLVSPGAIQNQRQVDDTLQQLEDSKNRLRSHLAGQSYHSPAVQIPSAKTSQPSQQDLQAELRKRGLIK